MRLHTPAATRARACRTPPAPPPRTPPETGTASHTRSPTSIAHTAPAGRTGTGRKCRPAAAPAAGDPAGASEPRHVPLTGNGSTRAAPASPGKAFNALQGRGAARRGGEGRRNGSGRCGLCPESPAGTAAGSAASEPARPPGSGGGGGAARPAPPRLPPREARPPGVGEGPRPAPQGAARATPPPPPARRGAARRGTWCHTSLAHDVTALREASPTNRRRA